MRVTGGDLTRMNLRDQGRSLRHAHHRENTMTRRFIVTAAAAILGLTVATGAVQAQTASDAMKKPDAMKTDTMKADPMKPNAMKTDAMGAMGSKADCTHKAGMEKDSMKKGEMMKGCDAM
jgi:pentapeptide MXKDX repeat protein